MNRSTKIERNDIKGKNLVNKEFLLEWNTREKKNILSMPLKEINKNNGKETFSDNKGNVINRLNIKEDLHQDMKWRVISRPDENYMISMMISIE